MARAVKPRKQVSMEEALWKSADKLRGSVEPAEYKHVVLSLFFLKFASDKFDNYINTHHIIGQEFDNVIFSMDSNFRYTEDGHLQGKRHPNPDYIFYKLWFQGVSRAREKLCILVIGNEPLFNNILKVKMQFEE